MILKDYDEIELPEFRGGSYSRSDRLFFPNNKLR